MGVKRKNWLKDDKVAEKKEIEIKEPTPYLFTLSSLTPSSSPPSLPPVLTLAVFSRTFILAFFLPLIFYQVISSFPLLFATLSCAFIPSISLPITFCYPQSSLTHGTHLYSFQPFNSTTSLTHLACQHLPCLYTVTRPP